MSTTVFNPNQYSIRETATITIDVSHQAYQYFSPPTNAAIQFFTYINPNGDPILGLHTILAHIKVTKMDRKEMLVYFAVSILDADGQKRFLKGFDWIFRSQEFICQPIISWTKLVNEVKLNFRGLLKLVVEASILEESPNPSSPCLRLTEGLQTLLETGKFADIVLLVKGSKQFKAHKAILSARSPVLGAMFELNCDQNRVEIPDIGVEAFEEFLRFLYTDQVHVMEKYALELYRAANKYQVEPLKPLCVPALFKSISIDTVAELVAFAASNGITELEERCLAFFVDHHTEIIAIDGWYDPLLSKPEVISKLVEQLSSLAVK